MKPRAASAFAVVALATVVLAGCGKEVTTTTTTTSSPMAPTTTVVPTTEVTTTVPETTTAAPTAEPTTTAPTAPATAAPAPARTTAGRTATPRTNAARPPAAADLPTTPGDYGDAAVAAWSAGKLQDLSQYVSPKARAALGTSAPAGPLLRVACEGDMCSYTSDTGERVTLTFDLATVKAGKPGGIVAVKAG